MTPNERIAAMRRGDLIMEQCCAWAARYPQQVPLINGEFEFIAAYMPEALRMTRRRPRLLRRTRHRASGWSDRDAPVRCFAQPDAHNHGDRSPSCSVNLASGAWNCHGCGARGGAYDAALATGHSPRSAMELLIAHGLAEPREDRAPAARTPSAHRQPDSPSLGQHHRRARHRSRADEDDVAPGRRRSTTTAA